MLDLAKIEAGRVRLDARPVDFGALVAATASQLAAPARAKGLQLLTEVEPLPPELLGGTVALAADCAPLAS